MGDPIVVSKGSNLYQTTGTLTEIITGCIVSIATEKKNTVRKGKVLLNSLKFKFSVACLIIVEYSADTENLCNNQHFPFDSSDL